MLGHDAMHRAPDIPSATGPRLFTSGGSWQEGDGGRWGQSGQVCSALFTVLPWHWSISLFPGSLEDGSPGQLYGKSLPGRCWGGSDCYQCHHLSPHKILLGQECFGCSIRVRSETTAQPQPKLGELISALTLNPNPQL